MPRLSFVVPVYKPTPDVFDAHLRALNDQALQNWEAIFVLDGPQPAARAAIERLLKSKEKRYTQARARFRIVEIEHAGAPAARNAGKAQAKGDIICFLDCDCIVEPAAAQAQLELFDKHSEIGFVYAGYKFLAEQGAVPSLPWDPYVLTVRNYISGCFPVRRELCPDWDPSLKSLQDWDFWLSVVENARAKGMDVSQLGRFMLGYAFKTEAPRPGSISAENCKDEVWLDRLDAVKKKHGIVDRPVCVSSLSHSADALRLAKILQADYWPDPSDKPHRYKHLVQVGYSIGTMQAAHAAIFTAAPKETVRHIFWTSDNLEEIWTRVNLQSVKAYRQVLNGKVKQYVEDKRAKDLMTEAGFEVEIMPMPLADGVALADLPKEPCFVADVASQYLPALRVVKEALPDIRLELIRDGERKVMSDFTGLIHFYPDRSVSSGVKRAHLTGRHVISNIKAPFCGVINDEDNQESFIRDVVRKVRAVAYRPARADAAKYYAAAADPARLKEALA